MIQKTLLVCFLSGYCVQGMAKEFVRFEHNNIVQYGVIENSTIQPLSGDIFTSPATAEATGSTLALSDVELVLPTNPQKVFAVGMNFASHSSSAANGPPPLFLKLPTSLIASGENIELPSDAKNVHFEGELVLVIAQQAKNLSESEAKKVIFGFTVGNDLTERSWQGRDLQWMRAKASDGFGPVGSIIITDIDYNNVVLTTRLNGEIVQQENTQNMIHKPAKVVSYLSQYFTLMPGDLIFMGTPGRTKALNDGDIVSVSISDLDSKELVLVENTIKSDN